MLSGEDGVFMLGSIFGTGGHQSDHDLHSETFTVLKHLIELVAQGGGQSSTVLVGHPKLKHDLRRPKMEEIGDRTTLEPSSRSIGWDHPVHSAETFLKRSGRAISVRKHLQNITYIGDANRT